MTAGTTGTSAGGGPEDPSVSVRMGRELDKLTRGFFEGSQVVATQGDEWFLAAVLGLDRCGPWVWGKLGGLGRRVVSRVPPIRGVSFPFIGRRSVGERIRKLLEDEAKRRKLDVPEEDFALFSARMATILELVLSGDIHVDDIAFEQEVVDDTAAKSASATRGDHAQAGGGSG